MSDTEFKQMLENLRKAHKRTKYESELLNQINNLEQEVALLEDKNSVIYQQLIEHIKENVELKYYFKTFAKRESVNLMRLIKESEISQETVDSIQLYVNRFIFRLNHCKYQRSTKGEIK